ncbi:hypothetical protein LDENG_00097900 [Lucifuga dentata]|nr:hypothetical protein LDENG_00097900 [Lucifuga dentata]
MHVFGSGRKPENPEETHADTGRTCKLHTERPCPGRESHPGPSCCEAAVLTTTPPRTPTQVIYTFYLSLFKTIVGKFSSLQRGF